MNDYVLKEKPKPASNDMVWAFDLGKGSIGEAVRRGNEFLHKASLLIPAEFAETKTAAGRRRMWRTRQAHKAREQWLEKVMRDAGIEVLKGRQVGKVDEPTEYKDMSKDGTGAYRKALKGHKGQIVYWDAAGELCVAPVYPHDSLFQKREKINSLGGKSKFYGFFQSDCPVRTKKEIPMESYKLVIKNEAKQKRRIVAEKLLPPCELTLRIIITKDMIGELTLADNTRVVASLDVWVGAGLERI
jgi:hypothetical protein